MTTLVNEKVRIKVSQDDEEFFKKLDTDWEITRNGEIEKRKWDKINLSQDEPNKDRRMDDIELGSEDLIKLSQEFHDAAEDIEKIHEVRLSQGNSSQ